ncbi:hypothetical protein [Paenibacillus oceani]|uniref:Extracellular solute-binding protein n=1 Tax=Paenibacillus oceani TaxID=2772510 RepID=A0A927GYS1_9BACL|nr:hypothetical protein [Paenibacillus oceani]MBD2862201.1 hypothetical protein [Paenibacillus oceani]
MKTKWLVHGVAWVVASTMLISCSGKPGAAADPGVSKAEDVQEAKQLSTEPVTLRVNNWNTAFQQAEFDTFFAEPVRKKYPFITLEYLDFTKSSANTIENLMAEPTIPSKQKRTNGCPFDRIHLAASRNGKSLTIPVVRM